MEEKGLVPDNGTADGIAVNVALEWRNRHIRPVKKVLRVELLFAQKLPCRTVEGVRALLGNRVDDDSGIASVFGAERVGLNLEFLNAVHVRLKSNLVLRHVAQVDAIEQVVCGVFARARSVDARNANAAGHGKKCAIVCGWNHRAGCEQRQIEEESAIERDFNDLPGVHHVTESGRFRLHSDRRRLHGDDG